MPNGIAGMIHEFARPHPLNRNCADFRARWRVLPPAETTPPGSGHQLRSIPSPSAMRTKPVILMGAPISLAAFSSTALTRLSPSMM